MNEEDLPKALAMLRQVQSMAGTHPPLEMRVWHRNGSWRVVEPVSNNQLDEPSGGRCDHHSSRYHRSKTSGGPIPAGAENGSLLAGPFAARAVAISFQGTVGEGPKGLGDFLLPGTLLYHKELFMKALLEAVQPGDRDWDLVQAIDPTRLPAHIAVIMDGNGRWAGRRRLPRVAGHKAGIGPVRSTVETCARLGVKVLTLYAFSVENWKRPRAEVETLWRLLRYYLKQELPDLQKNDIRLQAIGRLDALPTQVRRELESGVEATSANRGLLVNLAINYGGRAEIVDAVNAVLDMARLDGSIGSLRIDEDLIATNLYTATSPDPDLLIRTSGEMRISNFLLWQIAYAELYVTETLWPDFTRTDLLQALLEYQKRDRRYGGLSGRPAVPPTNGLAASDESLIAALRSS